MTLVSLHEEKLREELSSVEEKEAFSSESYVSLWE